MAGFYANKTTLTVGSEIAELTDVSFSGLTAETVDISSMDSPDQFREYVAGMRDGGEISVEGNFAGATETNVLVALLAAGTKTTGATIAYPTTPAATLTFDCYVTAYEVTAPYEDKIGFTATLKVTGKPVFS